MNTDGLDLWQLPGSLQQLVEEELNEGETITWIGQPIPKRRAMQSLPIVLFGIPWTAFALFWIAGAAGFQMPNFQNGADLFPLFGIPFVLIGLGMLSAPLWVMRNAKRTAYIITDNRVIMFEGGRSTTIRSVYPDQLRNLQRKQRADGSGDLVVDKKISVDSDGDRTTTDVGFLAIANVKAVEDLVRELVESSRPPID